MEESKKCLKCGNIVKADAKFCTNCGSSEFCGCNPGETVNQNVNPVPPVYQPPVNVNQRPPKKKNKGIIAIIIIAAVLVFAVTFFAVVGMLFGDSDSEVSSERTGETNEYIPSVEYTKGTFDGTIYTNEWANIKMSVPEGFTNASEEYYKISTTTSTDCGLYLMSENRVFVVQFEKLPTFTNYSEKSYLDAVMSHLNTDATKNAGVEYKITKKYEKTEVAGESYTVAHCDFTNNYGNYVHSFYVKRIENKAVCISVIGNTAEENDSIVKSIEKAK